jgi:nucleoside-diphosphate-sugar epimerase
MNVLITGGLGNVGASAVEALARRGHHVRCLDIKTRPNQRKAQQMGRTVAAMPGKMEAVWGDLRRPADLLAAVQGCDVVVHLAFIIPKLSATGVECEAEPTWAREINVGGTHNLLEAMRAQPRPPKLLFASSYHIYGLTQSRMPPLTLADPVRPIEHYAQHKVTCERMVRTSGLEWAIYRLAAALPLSMKLDPAMFDIPLENRMEFVHTRDVGEAIAAGLSEPTLWRRTWLIGGGSRCQYYYREIAQLVLTGLGVGMLPDRAFSATPFPTDWLDTSASQALLHYQQRDLGDYVRDMRRQLGYRRILVQIFRPWVRRLLLSKSPYWRATRRRSRGQALALSSEDAPVSGTA